jgi:hypothetical protein
MSAQRERATETAALQSKTTHSVQCRIAVNFWILIFVLTVSPQQVPITLIHTGLYHYPMVDVRGHKLKVTINRLE